MIGLLLEDDSAIRETIRRRLLSKCERDTRTGCLIYLGCWSENGAGRIRVGNFVFDVSRVAAWVHHGFDLFSDLYTSTNCLNQACFAKHHVTIGSIEEIAAMTPLFRRRRRTP